MLKLSEVTLVAVSSVDIESTYLALEISSHEIEFGAVKFLTSESVDSKNPKIQIAKIQKLDFIGYSRFVIEELHRFIDTPFCIVIQADGFILNAKQWKNEFLEYDYIGAPWPNEVILLPSENVIQLNRNCVGNGGFSLRSKRLLELTSKIKYDELEFSSKSEDFIICYFLYEEMIRAGIKFPPPQIAASFSIESSNAAYGQTPNTAFGFHGKKLRDMIFSQLFQG
jgi:hypothetical protein